ncbi:SixA phosphatase family protein [Geodermatophilus sp. SYSU D00815]
MQPRRLVLIRHAEAAAGRVDADRPLTERGERDAAALGAALPRPDRVLVSPARRAVQTWERAATGVGPVVEPRLYDNDVDLLLAVVRETPEEVRTLAVVGHNPSVGGLAHLLDDGAGAPAARDGVALGFPAGGVAVFDVPVPFAALEFGGATLVGFTAPRR